MEVINYSVFLEDPAQSSVSQVQRLRATKKYNGLLLSLGSLRKSLKCRGELDVWCENTTSGETKDG